MTGTTEDPARGGEGQKASAPSGNTITGNASETVQAGVVHTINYYGPHDKVDLFARQVNGSELIDVRKNFLPPQEFETAESVLVTHNVVILLGLGSGRTFAAQRLLDDQLCARIVHLNPERPMGSVGAGELRERDGYLWDLSERGGRPFQGWQLNRLRQLVTGVAGCRLVIILNDRSQAPLEADGLCVELEPPDAIELAGSAIDRDPSGNADAARRVLEDELAPLLPAETPPERALLAADLAIRVASGGLTPSRAKQEFEEGFDREVMDKIEDSWETIEYTLMFTIALLQNEPFDEVVAAARDLDDKVRTAELKDGKKLRPRRAFGKPNDRLLSAIGARTDMRDNPSHPGLEVATVRFVRTGWAEAVLCRIWQCYHVDHDLLLRWMCGPSMSREHFGASVWALSTLISQVPAGDRLRELVRLVRQGGPQNWWLAAATLGRLEDKHGFRELVEQAVAEWVDSEVASEKCAAVIYYGYRFDRAEEQSMAMIREIAREKMSSIHNTVVGTVYRLMRVRDRQSIVLRSVTAWANDGKSVREDDGLHSVALEIGVYLLRLTDYIRSLKLDLDPADIAERYPAECRHLAVQVLADEYYGLDVLANLLGLMDLRQFAARDERARKDAGELMRIVRLLTPDLRFRARYTTVLRLCHLYPTKRKQIRRIFRTARKLERSGL